MVYAKLLADGVVETCIKKSSKLFDCKITKLSCIYLSTKLKKGGGRKEGWLVVCFRNKPMRVDRGFPN